MYIEGAPGASSSRLLQPAICGVAVVTAVLSCALLSAAANAAEDPSPGPDQALGPVAAVRVQVEALARNDDPFAGAGISATWAFASPENRMATGPLERFRTLFESPAYAPMLGNLGARYSEARQSGAQALVGVVIATGDGMQRGYLFQLSRQDTDACRSCWMTDSVMPMPVADDPLRPGTPI